jgi:hypothetical protein
MTFDTYIRAQMARFAIEEAQRHGGVHNMIAVCQVLRNRVFAGWGDWLEVVNTAPSRRANSPAQGAPDLRHADVRSLLNRVEEIYTRADSSDLTGGALFYVDSTLPVLEWFEKEVLGRQEEHARTAHIGPVWFFK